MSKSKTTISDIAKYLNISPSTVSRALNNNKLISRATRESVLDAAKKMNYHPNQSAKTLKGVKSGLWGVLIPDLTNLFQKNIVDAIQVTARLHDYQLINVQSRDSKAEEKKAVELFDRLSVEGIFVLPSEKVQDYDHLESIQGYIPMVLVGNRLPLSRSSMVLCNDRQGVYDATRYLLDSGRNRIAFYIGPIRNSQKHEQKLGYLNALEDMGLEIDSNYIEEHAINAEHAIQFADRLLGLRPIPDAVISPNPVNTLIMMDYFKKYGLEIPKDIRFITLGESTFGPHLSPALSSIDRQGTTIGQIASEIMLENMTEEQTISPVYRIVRPKLVIRDHSHQGFNPPSDQGNYARDKGSW